MISQPGFAYTSRPMRRLARIGLAVLVSLLLAPSASRASVLPSPVPPAGTVRPGDEVLTRVPTLPDNATEFELVLVPDEGPVIQVCPETPAGVREVRWRVPRMAALRARLVLRAGGEGGEWESPCSEAFGIEPCDAGLPAWLSGRRSPAAVSFDGFKRSWSGLRAVPGTPELSDGRAGACAVPPPDSPVLTPPADSPIGTADSPSEPMPSQGRSIRPRIPTTIPLRN